MEIVFAFLRWLLCSIEDSVVLLDGLQEVNVNEQVFVWIEIVHWHVVVVRRVWQVLVKRLVPVACILAQCDFLKLRHRVLFLLSALCRILLEGRRDLHFLVDHHAVVLYR